MNITEVRNTMQSPNPALELRQPCRRRGFAVGDTMPFRMACVVVLFFVSLLTSAQTTLNGAGSTFVYPIMSKWAAEYHKQHAETQVSYLPLGSGAGIAQTMEGMLDFGGTDAPVSDAELARAKVPVIHVPVVLGADVPAYNLPDVHAQLRFTGQVLADIFLGKIRNWNDPAIASTNQDVTLPNQEITVVHRLDGSGTTYVWADYLSKVSSEWKNRVGKGTSVKWPVGVGSNGNEGVSERIREIKGAIGYIELSYAQTKKIPFGSVQNASGLFIAASVAGIKEAAASSVGAKSDLRVSISNAPGPKCLSCCKLLVDLSARPSEESRIDESAQGLSRLDSHRWPKVRVRSLLFASAARNRSQGAETAR